MTTFTRSADPGYTSSINVIPLVDIMLVLLIIFIITLPVMTHAVRIDLPRVNLASPPPPAAAVDLEVQFDGSVLWNGTPVAAADLSAYLANAARQVPQPEVHIAVDRRAPYDDASRVLFAVQRGGLKKIGFVTAARAGT